MSANILIVEDNELNLDMLMRRLSRHQYTITCARTAAEARQQIKQPPDLVLLDMLLPDEVGWKLALEWKTSAEFRNIPIIAVTAMSFATDRERGINAGCDAYITKPIDFPELHAEIERLLAFYNRRSGS